MSRSVALVIAILIPALSFAEDKPGEPRHLLAAPGPAPTPSLKHRLQPALHELTPGNAATLYYRALSFVSEGQRSFQALHSQPVKDDAGQEYYPVERWLEALRQHAAAHEGKLPATLDDVRPLPVPLDPVTGRPFVYRVEGAKATIQGPTPQGMDESLFSLTYVLTLPEK